MSKTKTISIIVPVFNSAPYLKECIDSVLRQTYRDFELILVDDGSTDDSAAICKKASSLDERVRFYSKDNSGVSDTRNYGMSKAKGDLLLFLDSDDYVQPDALMVLFDEMDSQEVDVVISGMAFFYPDGVFREMRLPDCAFSKGSISEYYCQIENKGGFNAPVAKLFKKEIISTNKLLFEGNMSILEDQTFVSQYLSYCKGIKCISYCGYYYRQTENPSLLKKFNVNSLYCLEKKYETDVWLRKLLFSDSVLAYYKKHYQLIVSFIVKIFRQKTVEKNSKRALFYEYKNSKVAKIICKSVSKRNLSFKQRSFLHIYNLPKALSFLCFRLLLR